MLQLTALRRLHLGPLHWTLDRGECASIMGASGAGKSLLLRMVADLDPHEGEMALDGVAASALPAPQWRAQVTYVAANSGWWAPRVADHFAPGTDFARLESVGLPAEAATWPVARLSTGERQRLAILRAWRPHTRVLLLDEPTSGLDPDNVVLVETLLRQALAQGVAIALVTHDPVQAARLATRHYRMSDGQLHEVPR